MRVEILNSMRHCVLQEANGENGWWLMTKCGSFGLQVLPGGSEFFGVNYDLIQGHNCSIILIEHSIL